MWQQYKSFYPVFDNARQIDCSAEPERFPLNPERVKYKSPGQRPGTEAPVIKPPVGGEIMSSKSASVTEIVAMFMMKTTPNEDGR